MKNFLKSGLLVAVAVMSLASSSQAGIMTFSGKTSNASTGYAAYNNIGWTVAFTYTASPTPAAAVIAGTTLTFAKSTPETFTLSPLLSSGTLTVDSVADTITTGGSLLFNPAFGRLSSFVVTSAYNAPAAVADDATLQALGTTMNTTFTGTFQFFDNTGSTLLGSVDLNGSVPAPEPGSIAVLCGLGLIVGRRVLKSRSSKKQEVAA